MGGRGAISLSYQGTNLGSGRAHGEKCALAALPDIEKSISFDYQSECHCSKTVNENLEGHGPRFIIDLSCSDIRREDAETKIAWLLEDPRIEEILLVKSKTLKRFAK